MRQNLLLGIKICVAVKERPENGIGKYLRYDVCSINIGNEVLHELLFNYLLFGYSLFLYIGQEDRKMTYPTS